MASATPSQRHGRALAHAQYTPSINIPALPPYEAPEAPLDAEQQRRLATLLSSRELKDLKTHIKSAAEKLTESAGQIGDRLCDAQVRYEREKDKINARRRAGSDEENIAADRDEALLEEQQRLTGMEQKVESLRGIMEERMRKVIDTESRLQALEDAVEQMSREEAQAQTQPRQTRSARRRPRHSGGGTDDEDDEQDGDYETTPEREARELNAQNPPSRRFVAGLGREIEKWDSLSMTQKVVHESKFPADHVPPLPRSSTWFEGREDPNASAQRTRSTRNREPSPAESDDIAIERERESLVCPLTQRMFEDPVTSGKCPHSFEREAIMSMISRSPTTVAPGPGQGRRRLRSIKCPECDTVFTAADLHSNPALVLKVQRAQKAQREAEEHLHDADDLDDPNRVTLTSDAVDADEMDVDVDLDADESDEPRVKTEPMTQEALSVATDSEEEATDSDEDEEDDDDDNEE
ncbi:Chromosomal organization and DNA repair protein Mms21 [Penicillium chermesinum]|nr:Chromosomal organization and DNA repair protein Mms21 [Penicillium chermesinum]